MNNKDRKVFWDTLCSLQGVDIDKEAELLRKTIKMPKNLYRFRPVTINSLDSLRTNTMYFSTADHYDDPFDSYSYIDWEQVNNQIICEYNDSTKLQNIASMIQSVFDIPANQVTYSIKSVPSNQWIEYSNAFLEYTREEIQRIQISICFTEQFDNEVLWLKYASQHKGFALEYQITDDFLVLNGKVSQQKCFLYPIYYSNKKYNATEYAKMLTYKIAAQNSKSEFSDIILNNLPKMNWHYERIGLIKHKCHEHDREWRILYPFIMQSQDIKIQRPKIERKPSSVIIGIRTGIPEKNLIISSAKEAGIPKIYQLRIDKSGKFVKELIYNEKQK